MATGFVTVDGKTYFLKDDGRMLTEAAEFVPDANGALSKEIEEREGAPGRGVFFLS